jgi:polyisoprenoid-binding protein YceI
MIVSTGLETSAQQVFKISPQSTMQIDGTSTLHDWSSKVENFRGEGRFTLADNTIQDITDLKISVVVKSINSGKGAMMDKNTYQALKSEQHPEIYYQLQSVKVLPNQKLITIGKLTIAGVSKTVNMHLNYHQDAAHTITITGNLPIHMREFNIDPPTAMMGTIKTGEEVTVVFKAVFTATNQVSKL